MRHLLRGVAGISDEAITRLFTVFSLDFRSTPPRVKQAGEGYFPPLALLPGRGILIGPSFVNMFLQVRNVIYALQRLDPSKFDRTISAHLEPQLLQTAEKMLAELPGLEFKPNVKWSSGEIDLLVFEAATNIAVQIQAKAALPPQGARMVARLENRINEGISQLRKFSSLNKKQTDNVVSNALGRQVKDVKLIDVVLARSCFGTHRVWSESPEVTFITLPILAELARPKGANRIATLGDLPTRTAEYIDAYTKNAKPIWTLKTLKIRDTNIDIPMLDFDRHFVNSERRRIWSGRALS